MKTRVLMVASAITFSVMLEQSLGAQEISALVLRGPIEAINQAAGTVTVLGQQVSVSGAMDFRVGNIANVFGRVGASGIIESPRLLSLAQLATGSEQLFIRGKVGTVSLQLGRLTIGSTQIDYTSLLSRPNFLIPSAGEVAEFVGTQPSAHGIFLASGSIDGAQLVTGSGLSANLVTGSGLKNNLVTGSGLSANLVTGSGLKNNLVTGSGLSANLVTGSGLSTNLVTGSGLKSNLVTGSGLSANLVTGSGLKSNLVRGSGLSTNLVTGSGLKSNLVTGSGLSTNLVTGSGASAH